MCVGKSTMDDTSKLAEATHPTGVGVEIVGIDKGDRGRSCEEHDVCGEVVEEDTLLRLRREQILVDGKEETAIACYCSKPWLWRDPYPAIMARLHAQS